MSNHANVIVDYESAPVRPSGLPNHYAEGIASHAVDENEVPTHQSAGYIDEKKVDNGDQGTIVSAYQEAAEDEDYEGKPTAEELLTLRKVAAPMPWPAIAMCAIELSERASYYGCTQVFGNFVRGSLPIGGNGAGAVAPGELGLQQSAGALGKGSQVATAITTSFTFLAYCFPILGGIVSDSYWGRFKTVSVGTAVGGVAHVLLVIPAIPKILQTPNTAFGLFVPFVYFLSLAAGFIKPCLGPMLCDQSPVTRNEIIVLKSGERVILSPQVTVQRYLLIFYTCINIGAFFGLATSYAAHDIGFWLAFLAPGIFYMLMPIVLVLCYKRLRKYPPQGTIVLEAFRATKSLFSNGNFRNLFKRGDAFWENAKPSNRIAAGESLVNVTWDDRFVDDLKRTFKSCAVFLLIPIFNLADGGLGNSENAMSASMTVNGVPNDLISNFNPLTIVIAAPIINYGLYPLFSKMGRPISPMWRMTIGFVLGGLNMIYGGVLQKKIYDLSPCGNQASTCPDPAPVSLWAQIPLYAVPAIGEIFINPTSYELAYTRAPPRMKGLVYSLCLFNQAISSAISLALSAVVVDPNLVIPYWVLGAACFVCAALFPFLFKELDEEINFHDPSMQSTDESVQEKKALSS